MIGPLPPPDRIRLSLDHPGWFVFSWDEVDTDCEVVHYRIIASNCGRCPTSTAHTTVVCTDIPTNGNNCTFAVHSGGLRTGTPISEHDSGCNFSYYISTILHDMEKEVPP